MSATFSLACYSIRFRHRNERVLLPFDHENLAGVRDFFTAYFLGLSAKTVNDTETQKLLTAREISVALPTIEGVIITGEYGIEADLVDVSGKKPKYRRRKNQAQMLPFYFRVFLPPQTDTGFLILQRFGLLGVRTILCSDLRREFSQQYPDITLSILPELPEGALEHILGRGEIRTVTLRRNTLPADLADRLELADANDGQVDLVVRAKHGSRFGALMDKARDVLNQKQYAKLATLIEADGFAHSRLLIGVDIGGKTKQVDLTDLNRLRAHIDVTESVELGRDGFPTFQSISSESADVLDGLKSAIGYDFED
ncbi:MAG TPA: hypothetical protein VHD61_11765 [Lacunisphaera sp.]|nr:hypothetical protein [Lacunisphaera sp.]